jgi:hypothetical protein
MAIKISVDGVEVEVGSVAEAAALIHALRSANKADISSSGAKYVPPPAQSAEYVTPLKAIQWALDFVTFLRKAGPEGATTEQVMVPLGVTDSKGVGGRMAIVNRLLESVTNVPVGQIYSNEKGEDGRVWMAGRSIDLASNELRQLIHRRMAA